MTKEGIGIVIGVVAMFIAMNTWLDTRFDRVYDQISKEMKGFREEQLQLEVERTRFITERFRGVDVRLDTTVKVMMRHIGAADGPHTVGEVPTEESHAYLAE